jgi:hypothetical protein
MVRALKYYLRLIPEVWKLAASLRGMWTIVLILAFAGILFFNQELGDKIIKNYDGIAWQWGYRFIVASIVYAFLNVNFTNYRILEDNNTQLKSDNDALSRVDLDIEYSGKPPHRDFVLDVDRFRVAVRNKSKTSDLKLVNLHLVDVTSIKGWNHNRSEMLLRQNGDNPPAGQPFREDAVLTPERALDYEFLSRPHETGAGIVLHYATPAVDTIPSDRQYRITLKATGSNCRAVFRQFLTTVDNRQRLTVEAFPSYVKPLY